MKTRLLMIMFLLLGVAGNVKGDFIGGVYYGHEEGTDCAYVYGCDKGITKVNIPSSVTFVVDKKYIDGEWVETKKTYLVTSIKGSAFSDCNSLQSVTIPSSVTSIGHLAFIGCSSLQSVTIPKGVTSIGDGVFSGCSSLQSIILPSDLTSIGEMAFYDCTGLQEITIPLSVISIGRFAFGGCSSLQSVTIPKGVTSIGDGVFSGCSSLQSVTIPEGMISIGADTSSCQEEWGTFFGCNSLQSVTIPSSVTSMGRYAFCGCSNLQSVTISEGVTSMGERTFFGCSSLQSVTIPSSVTSIGEGAFTLCSSLQSITIPSSVTSIENNAFDGCSSMISVTILEGVTVIKDYVFWNCSSLQWVSIPKSVTEIGHMAFDGCDCLQFITIPSGVTRIKGDAFACSSLKYIYCQAKVPPIIDGDTFFYLYDHAMTLYIPKGTRQAYYDAPYWRNFFKSGNINDPNVIEIGEDEEPYTTIDMIQYVCNAEDHTATVFRCLATAEGAIDIPETITRWDEDYTVTKVAAGAFSRCVNVTSVRLPKTVFSVGSRAFLDCEKLASVNIPSKVTSIQESVFEKCLALKNFSISDNVRSIAQGAFKNCTNLSNVVMGCRVSSIGSWAFQGCNDIKNITCMANTPPSVTEYTFSDYGAKLHVPNGSKNVYENTDIWKNFTNIVEEEKTLARSGLKYKLDNSTMTAAIVGYTDEIPDTLSMPGIVTDENVVSYKITSVAEGAFKDCKDLKYVYLSWNLTTLGDYAFYGSGLTSITLPDKMERVGKYAFTNLTQICCQSPSASTVIDDLSFCKIDVATGGVMSSYDTPVYVLKGCKPVYESADVWKNFTDIREVEKDIVVEGVKYDYNVLIHRVRIIGYTEDLPEDVVLPETIVVDGSVYEIIEIQDYAFYKCAKLKTIMIPAGVSDIGTYAFRLCTRLQSITVSPDNEYFTSIKGALVNKSLSLLWICPEGMTGIFEVSEGVKGINNVAFLGCSKLTSVIIPGSVTSIGRAAFSGCPELKDIYCWAVTPPALMENAFDNYEAQLHVPVGCKEAYEAADYWRNFTNIVEEQSMGLDTFDADSAIRYADGMLYLKDTDIPAAITIYTAEGKCIRSCKAVAGVCDLSMLPDGVYIVRICIDGKVTDIKILK